MLKGFFLSLPSASVNNTLLPVIDTIASSGYEIIFYNNFKPKGNFNFKFKAYPYYKFGYNSNWMNTNSSYYQLTEILINTTASLMNFLVNEVERERPDFILHPHLSIWAKLLATHFKLPAIMLCTTFIMDKRIMVPHFKEFQIQRKIEFKKINYAVNFWREAIRIYKKLEIRDKPDIWDAYINRGDLNLVFILKEFQPKIQMFDEKYKFLGFPLYVENDKLRNRLIYISLGTILNNDAEFYNLCIRVLKLLKYKTILSIGNDLKIASLGEIPQNIVVNKSIDQIKVLTECKLFLTSGGMASVNEAIVTKTPMIVIPQTTEQKITAKKIDELGIGIHIKKTSLTDESLHNAICKVMGNHSMYYKNIISLTANASSESVKYKALNLVSDYLNQQLN